MDPVSESINVGLIEHRDDAKERKNLSEQGVACVWTEDSR